MKQDLLTFSVLLLNNLKAFVLLSHFSNNTLRKKSKYGEKSSKEKIRAIQSIDKLSLYLYLFYIYLINYDPFED